MQKTNNERLQTIASAMQELNARPAKCVEA